MAEEAVPNALPVEQAQGGQAPPTQQQPAESWNPLKTPVAWIILLLQAGIAALAAYETSKAGGQLQNLGLYLEHHGLVVGAEHLHDRWWRIFPSLVAEPLGIQVILNLYIWFSVGPALERVYGSIRLVFLYVIAGIGCYFLCDLLQYWFPDLLLASQGRSAARHAVIACAGSWLGLLVALKGIKATFTSSMLWGRLGGLAILIFICFGLSVSNQPIGIDWKGMLIDSFGGSIFGFALGLTLHRGAPMLLGILLTFLLTCSVGAEGLVEVYRSVTSDSAGFRGNKPAHDGSRNGSFNSHESQRQPEEAAMPRPTLPDDDNDPKEIARMRKKANEFLVAYGALPQPSGSSEDQRPANNLYEELKAFDERWTGSASANLETEMAELALIANQLSVAESNAEKALRFMEEKLTPAKAQGTLRAKRIARLHGVLGACYAKRGDDIAAKSEFQHAGEWDPMLHDVHYFLGKLGNDKQELKTFLDRVGTKPPEWQIERVREARQLLDN